MFSCACVLKAAGLSCDCEMLQSFTAFCGLSTEEPLLITCRSCLNLFPPPSVSPESAERRLQSPGELRGASGTGQSDAVLLGDGRFHAGKRKSAAAADDQTAAAAPACLSALRMKWLVAESSVHIRDFCAASSSLSSEV